MSASNGVIRIGRKGIKKFAFGEDGATFEVDVVQSFQEWICIDEAFRERNEDRTVLNVDMAEYHHAAVEFVTKLSGYPEPITIAEALDFIARLREQYDEVATFFQPRLREERELPDTLGTELRFSVEGS